MKHLNNYKAFVVILLAVALVGCQKFEPVKCEITSCVSDGMNMTGSARITDDGGTSHFAEQGFCYSLYDTLSATQVYTTMVPVVYSTDSLEFSWSYKLPMADTVYYVCAYVKNNAGIAYSETKQISTSTKNTSK